VALWEAVQRGDHQAAFSLHKKLLALWNTLNGDNLPACVKYALDVQGCETGYPRAPMSAATPSQQAAIRAALKKLLG
jgi:4-hydroxy-tetrahydrodipicolinate synthase